MNCIERIFLFSFLTLSLGHHCLGQNSLLAQRLDNAGGDDVASFSSTTMEEYNYVKSGLRFQVENGLDLRNGYSLKRMGQWGMNYNSNSWRRRAEFFQVYKDNGAAPCAMLMIASRSDTDYQEWFCIPAHESAKGVWSQCFKDWQKYTENWNAPSRAYSWGMIHMLSMSFSIEGGSENVVEHLEDGVLHDFRFSHSQSPLLGNENSVIVVNTKSTDCDGVERDPGAFQHLISSLLVSEYKVLERAQLGVVFDELEFGMTGLVNEQELLEAGMLAGAQGAVICSENCLDGVTQLKTVKLIDCQTGESQWSATGIGLNSTEFVNQLLDEF